MFSIENLMQAGLVSTGSSIPLVSSSLRRIRILDFVPTTRNASASPIWMEWMAAAYHDAWATGIHP